MILIFCTYAFLSSIDLFKEISQAESLSATKEDTRIKYMSRRLEKALSQLARDEIGVMALQAAFDNTEYHARPKPDSDTRSKSLVAKFSRRLMDYTNLVTGTRASVTRLYEAHKKSPLAPRFECCNLSERDLSLDPTYGCRVSRRKCCDLIPRSLPLTSFNPGHNLTKRFQKLLDYWPHVKWFYFITADGLHSEFPAHNFFHSNVVVGLSDVLPSAERRSQTGHELPYPIPSRAPVPSSVFYSSRDPAAWQPQSLPNIYTCHALHNLRHRDTFVRSVVPAPIWLIVVVDQGQASQTQVLLGHRVAQLLVASLSEKDRVAILLASDSIQSAFSPGPGPNNTSSSASEYDIFQPAVSSSKSLLNSLLANVHRPLHVKTNHTLALVSAFDAFRASLVGKNFPSTMIGQDIHLAPPHLLLAYVSRGYLNELGEAAKILQAVNDQQRQLPPGCRVVINAYMTVEEKSGTDPKERSFMINLADSWNSYSNAESQVESSTVRPGHFFEINRSTDFSDTVGRFYELFSPPYMSSLNVSLHRVNDSVADLVGMNASTGNPHLDPPVQYSLPHHDLEGSGGLVVSISQAFYDGNSLIGVMGIDVHVADLFDNFIHFTDGAEVGGAGSTTAFVVHAPDGYALMHPAIASDPRLSLPLASDWLKTALFARSRNGLGSIHESLRRHKEFGSSSTQSAWYSAPEPGVSQQHQSTGQLKSASTHLFPHFKSPESTGSALHLDIGQLEVLPGFVEHVRTPLLTRTSGSIVLPVHLSTRQLVEVYGVVGTLDTCASNATAPRLFRVVYSWRRVLAPRTPFVVVFRSVETSCAEQSHLTPLVPDFEFHYHRLDLLKLAHTCLYLRQLATFDFGTIYLAPKAFSRPFARLRQTSTDTAENLNDVRHLMAYLLDHTMLISNPGLNELTRPSIRSSVAVVERIGKFWAHRIRVGNLRHSIVRRYVAMDTGVMLVYPGSLLPETFDPTVRTWYRRALAAPGHIVATGPYLDERGVGHIITLSRTIFEGNATGIHDPSRDKVSAVIAIDVSHLLIQHLLSVWLPDCSGDPAAAGSGPRSDGEEGPATATSDNVEESRLRQQQHCVLMDDRGYLLEHPRWSTMPEHNHLHYHEPIVAADLLKNHEVMEKETCVHYPSRSIQRYYSLRTGDAAVDEVIENVSPKMDQCVTYQFLRVQHTNLYVGLISKRHRVGCSPRTAFCPCSAVGRRCFNCVRLEPKECECPCECPLSAGGLDAPRWPPAMDVANASVHSPGGEFSPCPALLELEASHPIPLASLVASMASLTGKKNALPVCSNQVNSDLYRETALLSSSLLPEPSPFSLSPLGPDFEFADEAGRTERPGEHYSSGFAGLGGETEPSGGGDQQKQRCWELDRLACGGTTGQWHYNQCRWCSVLSPAGSANNRSVVEFRCLPTFLCPPTGGIVGSAMRSPGGRAGSDDWSLSSSFTWHSNIEQQQKPVDLDKASREHRSGDGGSSGYTYRQVEWMTKRSRLISPDGHSHSELVGGSHNTAWWFGASPSGPHRFADASAANGAGVQTQQQQFGPVAGALLALFTVLLLILLLVYLVHRRCCRPGGCGPSLLGADGNRQTVQLVLPGAGGGFSGLGNKKATPDGEGDAGCPPPARGNFPSTPPPGGTDGSAMVPLLVLLETRSSSPSSGASSAAGVATGAASVSTPTVTGRGGGQATLPTTSSTTQGSDTESSSSVVGRSFKSVVSSSTSSASSAAWSSKASSSGVTGSLSAFTLKSGRRRHCVVGVGGGGKRRPEFDSLLEVGDTPVVERGDVAVAVVANNPPTAAAMSATASCRNYRRSTTTTAAAAESEADADAAAGLLCNHVYRLPVVITPQQRHQQCASSEPESAVASDGVSSCTVSSSSSSVAAVPATLLAVRVKAARRMLAGHVTAADT